MNISDLRQLASLDEAYVGKNNVSEIEKVLEDIRTAIKSDSYVNLYKTDLIVNLQKAIKNVFGFGDVRVYWKNSPVLGYTGPYTMPASRLITITKNAFDINYYKQGTKGFYDKKHTLRCYIQMDQYLVTGCDLSAAEMTAIILHEIGHNFDFTITTVTFSLYTFFADILSQFIAKPSMVISNLGDKISRMIPFLNKFFITIKKLGLLGIKLTNILNIPAVIGSIPGRILSSPISYLSNTGLRHKETYSDSFAAAYGYSSELITALDKLNSYMLGKFKDTDTGLAGVFGDIIKAQSELVGLLTGGHGSTQQRAIRMLDKLKKDIDSGDYDASTKKELLAEYDDLKKTYDNLVALDPNTKNTFTHLVRQVIDKLYDGKNHMFIPMTSDDHYV